MWSEKYMEKNLQPMFTEKEKRTPIRFQKNGNEEERQICEEKWYHFTDWVDSKNALWAYPYDSSEYAR